MENGNIKVPLNALLTFTSLIYMVYATSSNTCQLKMLRGHLVFGSLQMETIRKNLIFCKARPNCGLNISNVIIFPGLLLGRI
jgi:hypothetical protein